MQLSFLNIYYINAQFAFFNEYLTPAPIPNPIAHKMFCFQVIILITIVFEEFSI